MNLAQLAVLVCVQCGMGCGCWGSWRGHNLCPLFSWVPSVLTWALWWLGLAGGEWCGSTIVFNLRVWKRLEPRVLVQQRQLCCWVFVISVPLLYSVKSRLDGLWLITNCWFWLSSHSSATDWLCTCGSDIVKDSLVFLLSMDRDHCRQEEISCTNASFRFAFSYVLSLCTDFGWSWLGDT